ncbi:MAG TPA: hypothetical protein VFI31_18945 [Pirellulales bacterium]|nr:hypothetical protein [Pirellulales bacterium]
MATTAKNEASAEGAEKGIAPKGSSKVRRWKAWLITALVLVAAAPTVVCKTPLRNVVMAAALGKAPLRGQVTTGSLSVGWFSPLVVSDIEVRDLDSQVLASVPELSLTKSLLDLLLDRTDLGRLRFDRPSIELRLRDDGSNLEDVFPNLAAKASIDAGKAVEVVVEQANHSPIAVEIEINDGEVALFDLAADREWKFQGVKLHLVRPPTGPMEMSFSATMPDVSAESHLELEAGLTADNSDHGRGTTETASGAMATFEAVGFPLESLRALVARRAPGVALAGEFNGKCEWTGAAKAITASTPSKWGSAAANGSIVGDFAITNFLLTSPQLGEDVLKLAKIDLPCKLSMNGNEVAIEQLALRTDVGELTCKGDITLAGDNNGTGLPADLLQTASCDVVGQLDVAKIARLLPHRARLQLDAGLASAPVNFHLGPRLRRDGGWILELAAGRVLDHVHATPGLCDAWLKFAIPVMAEVTQVDGEFSVDLAGCRLPLDKPATGQSAGTISVHNIELGPGPFLSEFEPVLATLGGLLGKPGAQPLDRLTIAHDSQVEFRMVDGRVYHRGLRLQLPELTIETYGSVGLDESLAMVAEISLADKLLAGGPLDGLVPSRPWQVPISGTLQKPKLDMRELSGLGETLRDTAKGLLGDKVESELNRLFKK